jgi:hypothetical protein
VTLFYKLVTKTAGPNEDAFIMKAVDPVIRHV